MVTKALGVYSYAEIIQRFISKTDHLEGPSGYPVEIGYNADNSTEPPVVSLKVFEGTECIFDTYVDQNTALHQFNKELSRLSIVIAVCLSAINEHSTFKDEWDKIYGHKEEQTDDDLPF